MADTKTTETKTAGAGTAYKLVHQVGPYVPGTVLTFSAFDTAMPPEGRGVSIKRLKDVGAIEEASSEDAKQAVTYGSGEDANFVPLPKPVLQT